MYPLAFCANTPHHDIMLINLKAVFLPHRFIYIRKIGDIHIKYGAAYFALEVIVLPRSSIKSVHIIRQRYLTYCTTFNKQPQIAVNSRLADSRVFFMDLCVHALNCQMRVGLFYCFQNNLAL